MNDLVLIPISEENFHNISAPLLFENQDSNRKFATLSNIEGTIYKLAWQSSHIKPIITYLRDNCYSIGIDLDLAIFDTLKQTTLLKIQLSYLFHDSKVFNDNLYILTELEVIKISMLTYEPTKFYGLPDSLAEILFVDGAVKVECVNGEIVDLD